MIASKKRSDLRSSPRAVVAKYIAGVLDGSIVVGRLVRLAVERHVADLKNAGERGYYFDEQIAEAAIRFFPAVCQHSIGEWASKPFVLEPWQQFIVWCLMGWRRTSDNMRRFRKAFLSMARKNGKSTFCAALLLLLLVFDFPREPGGQIYVAATKEEQARIVFDEAKRMVETSPALRSRLTVYLKRLVYESAGAFACPIGSDSKVADGYNPSAVFRDELHAWAAQHRGLHEKLGTGGASRRQPLEVTITTAGDEQSEIWAEELEHATKTVEVATTGQVVSDSLFSFIACLDPEDDPLDEACWPKANPNLDVSVKREYLRDQANEARQKPTALSAFIRYHGNRRVTSTVRAIPAELWAGNAGTLSDWSKATAVCGGIDLGWRDDFACVAAVARFDDQSPSGTIDRYEARLWTYCCRDSKRPLWQEPFSHWQRAGLLTVTEGNTTDIATLRRDVVDISAKHGCRTWAIDPNNARQLGQELQDEHGLAVFEFVQSCRTYNEPTRKLLDLLASGGGTRFRHDGNAVLAWMAGNLSTYENARKEMMPSKRASTEKIDGVVATIMALERAMMAGRAKKKTSRYEDANAELEVL